MDNILLNQHTNVCLQLLIMFSNYPFICLHLLEFIDKNYTNVDNYYLIAGYISCMEKEMLTSNLLNFINYIECNSINKKDFFNKNKTTNYLLYIDLVVNERFETYNDAKVNQIFLNSNYYSNCKAFLLETQNRISNFKISNEEKQILHSFTRAE